MLARSLPRLRIVLTVIFSIVFVLQSQRVLSQATASSSLATLPVVFEANRGQGPSWVRYIARTSEGQVTLGSDRIQVQQPRSAGGQSFEMRFRGANPHGFQEESMHGGVANYYYGGRYLRRIEQIPLYRSVRYKELFSGIDGNFHGRDGRLEYDFELAPHASTELIQIDLPETERAILQENGSLTIESGGHSIRLLRPEAFQKLGDRTVKVPVTYRLIGRHSVGFKVDAYDQSKALMIDPVVSYAETIIAANDASVSAVTVDASGDLILTGNTYADNIPVINGQPGTSSGSEQVFVTKFDPAGDSIVYSTYLPANGFSTASSIAVDASGDAFIAGITGDLNFPVTSHELGVCSASFCNAGFVTKLDATGALLYSTLLGSGQILPKGLAVDSMGHAFVSGLVSDNSLQTVHAYQAAYLGGVCTSCYSAFFAELNPSGTSFVFSSYLGSGTIASGIALDAAGNIYVAGPADNVYGATVPLKNELQSAGGAFFLSKFAPDGKTLLFGTFLGGSPVPNAVDTLAGIAIGSDGTVYLGGNTGSDGFPYTLNAFLHPNGAPSNARMFAMAINPSLTDLKYSTDLGDGAMNAMHVDSGGNFYAAATTASVPIQPKNAVTADVTSGGFFLELDPSGVPLQTSAFGGQVVDGAPAGIAVDQGGNIYLAGGFGGSNPFVNACDPILVGSNTYGGQPSDGCPNSFGIFVAKIAADDKPQISVSQNLPFIFLHDVGSADLNISSITFSGGLEQAGGTCGQKVLAGTTCVLALTDAKGKQAQGSFTINSDASPGSQTFTPYLDPALVGVPVKDFLYVDTSQLHFLPQFAGTQSAPQAMRIWNAGITNLALNAIHATPYLTETNNCPAMLAPGAYCTVQVGWDTTSTYQSDAIGISYDGNPEVDDFLFGSYTVSPTALMLSQTNPIPFGNETQGNPSLYRTLTVTNVNTSAVSAPSVAVGGDPAFSIVGNTCPASLAPQQSCVVGIAMDSSTPGQPTANVNFSGSLSASINVYGTVNSPQSIVASTYQLQWQPVLLGTSSEQNLTLTNPSSTIAYITQFSFVSSEYTETDNCSANPLPAGASCTVQVTFTPQALGQRNDSLTILGANTSTPPLRISLSGEGQYALDLSPSVVDFGVGNLVNQSSTGQNVTVTNETAANATYTLNASGPFTAANQCPNPIPAHGTCTVALTYHPTAVENDTGTLTIAATGSSITNSVSLFGASTLGAIMSVPSGVSFADTQIGQSASATIAIANTGKANISNISFVFDNGDVGDFSMTPGQCASIAVGGTCSATVAFAPTVLGTRWASLLITSNASDSPRPVTLTGAGVVVGANLSIPTLAFGNQDIGSQSAASSISLTNTGTDALTITGITTSPDFPATNNCGASLAASASCQIAVRFSPSVAGPEMATLTVTDNAGTQTAALSGTGTVPTVAVGPASGGSMTSTVAQGQLATYALSLTGSAGFQGTVALACSGAPQFATCTLSANSVAVTPGSTTPFTVTVTTQTTTAAAVADSTRPFVAVGMLLLCFLFPRRFRRGLLHAAVFGFALIALGGLSACGGGSSSTPPAPTIHYTPAGTYNLTLTATSGAATVTQPLVLTVQ